MIMETKRTSPQDGQVKIVLILRKGRPEMVVYFPYVLLSKDRPTGLLREYRFSIALDQAFDILQTKDSSGRTSFIINLDSPPPFRRKLIQSASGSHDKEGTRWVEDDSWTRQTDIVRHKNHFEKIDKTPVTVRKALNSICIGRWNTFRLTIDENQQGVHTTRIFSEALQDYNVAIQVVEGFKLNRVVDPPEPFVWSGLDNIDTDEQRHDNGNWLNEVLSQVCLTFPVRYQLEVCISHGWLNEYNITQEFLKTLCKMPEYKATQFLICVAIRAKRFFNPMDIFEDMEFKKPVKKRRIPNTCMEIYHATVTATNLLFNTPSVEMTNRVVRQYKQHADRFLRVRFEDDEYRGQSKIFPSSGNNKMQLIFRRVERTLRHGIKFADRHYEFLAWGNSQLREHGAYFFASDKNTPTAASIRAELGKLDHEMIVAKRAARLGQCFSTTKAVRLRLPPITRDNLIPDVVTPNGKYNFTDGVGQISHMAATIAANQLKLSGPLPSVMQFRLGGCKGILTFSPALRGNEIKIRESQFKFNSDSGELEIIRHSEFWQACLNRQLILILSELGVPDHVFLVKQQQEIDELEKAMKDDEHAITALRNRVDPNRMTIILSELVADGFRQREEPFVKSILGLWRTWCLKYVKEKAKLYVPNGAFLLGCVDETATLRGYFDNPKPLSNVTEEKYKSLPEIFLQITDPQTGKLKIIEGTCIVARNPSLHPGDIRVVRAVNVHALHHLRDVVVMPQTGDRDLPSMCAGGDLDGDDYIVIWDHDLLPKRWDAKAFHYEAPPPKMAQGEITEKDYITFFLNYMKNDFLGQIAHAHMAWADYLNSGINSDQCLELVRLHSMAVDFPKTGVPAVMRPELRPPAYPHYMEKKVSTYPSDKILGLLYDQVELANFIPDYKGAFDQRILNAHTPSQDMMQSAAKLKQGYDKAMQRIMAQHSIKTEFEVWTTFVLHHSKAASDYKFHEEIGQLSKALKEEYYEAIVDTVGGRDRDTLAPFAVAAYKITQYEVAAALREVDEHKRSLDPAEMPFVTFPWLLHDILGRIATTADQESSELAVVIDGNLVTGDSAGNAAFDAAASHISWAAQPLLGTHFDQRYPDPYQPERMAKTEPASTSITESLLQDLSVMPSQVSNLHNTTSESPAESSNPVDHQYPVRRVENTGDSLIDSNDLINSPLAQPALIPNRPLVTRPSRLTTQDLPKSSTGVVEEDGVYRSPFRHRSVPSESSSAGRRSSAILSAVSPSTTIPIDTAAKEEDEPQVFSDPASDPNIIFAATEEDDW
jgi:RNA-dependent RNA polymerase